MAGFTKVTAAQIRGSLARRFVPLADKLRDLLTKFGLRTYTVSVVRIRWSGMERGSGFPEVISTMLIEPTPKVADLTSLEEIVQPVGVSESGEILLTQISGTY